jgi:hypothetical protein
MLSTEAQRAEVAANYEAFERALPGLLAGHKGEYAVFRHEQLVDVFESFASGLAYCISAYSDRLFSIQEITDEPLNLGWLSNGALDRSVRPGDRADHPN